MELGQKFRSGCPQRHHSSVPVLRYNTALYSRWSLFLLSNSPSGSHRTLVLIGANFLLMAKWLYLGFKVEQALIKVWDLGGSSLSLSLLCTTLNKLLNLCEP